MNTQLSERIKENSKAFSKGQRLIAKYIDEYPDKVAFMTAARLGVTVGVSESTVLRFATEIGYSGYPALQKAMQEMIKNKLNSVQRLEMTSNNIIPEKLLDAALDQDINTIKRTKESVDHEEFRAVVNALVPVKKVYILGAGSSLALATFLSHYLTLIFDTVHLLDVTGEAQIFQEMVKIGKDDAIISISFPRYSKRAVKALKYAGDKGAVTIAITDTLVSPIAQCASYSLLARSDMVSFVDSLSGPLSLINALIVAIAIEKKDEVVQTLKSIEDIWDEYGVYEKAD